jgi:hypothetical protein
LLSRYFQGLPRPQSQPSFSVPGFFHFVHMAQSLQWRSRAWKTRSPFSHSVCVTPLTPLSRECFRAHWQYLFDRFITQQRAMDPQSISQQSTCHIVHRSDLSSKRASCGGSGLPSIKEGCRRPVTSRNMKRARLISPTGNLRAGTRRTTCSEDQHQQIKALPFLDKHMSSKRLAVLSTGEDQVNHCRRHSTWAERQVAELLPDSNLKTTYALLA